MLRGPMGFIALTARVIHPDYFLPEEDSPGRQISPEVSDDGKTSPERLEDGRTPLQLLQDYFADPDVKASIQELYKLPESPRKVAGCRCRMKFSESTLYQPGTTSIILGCPVSPACDDHAEKVALKLILLPYTAPGYSHITKATQRTFDVFSELRRKPDKKSSTPEVYRSGRTFVVMEFVSGPTLREVLNDPEGRPLKDWLKRHRGPVRFALLRSVGEALVSALETMQKADQTHVDHQDLNPSNVIIRSFEEDKIDVVLLDIGRNYLLTSGVGTAPLIIEAGRYVAPELRGRSESDPGDPTKPSPDLYSLGMILLDLADLPEDKGGAVRPIPARKQRKRSARTTGRAPTPLPRVPRTTSETLSRVFEQAPGLGRLLEDLVEGKADLRLLDFTAEQRANPYAHLKARLDEQLDLAEIAAGTAPKRANTDSSFGSLISLLLFKEPKAILQASVTQPSDPPDTPSGWLAIIHKLRKAGGASEEHRRTLRLGLWATACSAACYLCVLAIVSYALADLRASRNNRVDNLAAWMGTHVGRHAPFLVSAVRYNPGNFPARLVALTFALLGARYYLNIFATLSCRAQNRMTEAVIRSQAVFFVAPILAGNAISPHLWPFFAAGASWAALNNWMCHSLASSNLARATEAGFTTLGDNVRADVQEYRTWWWLMLLYGVGLAGLGVAFALHIGHDQLVDAVMIGIGLNIFKLYVSNCGTLAPTVRSCLARSFAAGDRLKRHAERNAESQEVNSGAP
jgi:serine/threonine protein kinase